MTMTHMDRVCSLDELPDRRPMAFSVAGRALALVRVAGGDGPGRVFALTGACPHRGGPLAEGSVAEEAFGEPVLACPWHGWQFCLEGGANPVNPAAVAQAFRVSVEGHDVLVDLGPDADRHGTTEPRGRA